MCDAITCGKKVVDENNASYRCEKCNKTYDKLKWHYMVSVCNKCLLQDFMTRCE
jgi:Zn finger protein HypA/HybF involved in hydrogenase expression